MSLPGRGSVGLWTAIVAIGASLAVPHAAAADPPRRAFFGVVPQGPLTERDLDRMEGVVGRLRVPVVWADHEAAAHRFEFERLDRLVLAAAEHGIRVLPFIYGTPQWVAHRPTVPPLRSAAARRAWMGFLQRLVGRYGPRGTVWRGRRSPMPIRRWQIWNEPNFRLFWTPRPSARAYVRLLRISARAIRRADSGARILAAGIAPIRGGVEPWRFLRRIYRVPGAGRYFEAAALHPYSSSLAGVLDQILRARLVMFEAGDRRTPLVITELGVASDAVRPTSFDRGPAGQARYLRRVLRTLSRERSRWRIGGVDWFSWQDGDDSDPSCPFCAFSGLVRSDGSPKPSWNAFRRVTRSAELPP